MPNTLRALGALALFAAVGLAGGCAPLNPGVPGSSAVTHPAVDGTVFTIVFENENADDILQPELPTFFGMSQTQGRADAYVSYYHPSLANYIMMTSGTTHGITTSDDPATNVQITDTDNLPHQLDEAGVPWRAYMESMGEPCNPTTSLPYGANHNPFVYYHSLTDDPERCREHVVDFDEHFAEDLASDQYRYMWITPNRCNDMHDCEAQIGDAWLGQVLGQIMASPGYQRGGVVFVLFDEGYLRIGNAGANLATLVISPMLVSPAYVSNTAFDHRSYLATIEDIFGMPRLPTTVDATPMGEFFQSRPMQ